MTASWPPGRNCHYCGVHVSGRSLHRDHFKPKSKGGRDIARNLVYACGSCNSTKGPRLFEQARPALMLRRLGWPSFKPDQLEWLKSKGFDLSPLENGKLYFEEQE
jgi:5-methylcytosine-specific restriction endonuclease McrA